MNKPIVQPPPTRQQIRLNARKEIWESLKRIQFRMPAQQGRMVVRFNGPKSPRWTRRANWAYQCDRVHRYGAEWAKFEPSAQ